MENSNSQSYQRAINSYASQIANKRGRLSSIEEGLDAKKRAEREANYNISFQKIQDAARAKLLSSIGAKQREDSLAISGGIATSTGVPALQKGLGYGKRLLQQRRENVVNQKAYDRAVRNENVSRGAEEPKQKGPRVQAQEEAAPREAVNRPAPDTPRPREESYDAELDPDAPAAGVDNETRIAQLNDALNADRGVSAGQGETAVENLARNRAESIARSAGSRSQAGAEALARARAPPLGGRRGLHPSQAEAETELAQREAPKPTIAENAAGRGGTGAEPAVAPGEGGDQLAPMRELMAKQGQAVQDAPKAALEGEENLGKASANVIRTGTEEAIDKGGAQVFKSTAGGLADLGAETGAEVAGEAGAGALEIGLGAASTALDFLGPVGIAAGIGFALYDLFGHHSKPKPPDPPPPPKPVQYIARQAQFGRQSAAVAPSQNTAAQQSGAIGSF